jgi:hypothetical protein
MLFKGWLALILGTVAVVTMAHASLPADTNVSDVSQLSPGANLVTQHSVFDKGGVISAFRDMTLTPLWLENGNGPEENVSGATFSLQSADSLYVADSRVADNGETLVRLQRENETDDEGVANDGWFRLTDLNENEFHLEVASIAEALETPYVDNSGDDEWEYLTTNEARAGHRHSLKRISKGGGSYCTKHPTAKHCCYSAVKYALQQMGLVNHRLGGASGYMAARELAREGWHEVGCKAAKNPKVGMVCSYHGYTGGNGHAEVWKKCPGSGRMGWYYGASCSSSIVGGGCFSCKVKR